MNKVIFWHQLLIVTCLDFFIINFQYCMQLKKVSKFFLFVKTEQPNQITQSRYYASKGRLSGFPPVSPPPSPSPRLFIARKRMFS